MQDQERQMPNVNLIEIMDIKIREPGSDSDCQKYIAQGFKVRITLSFLYILDASPQPDPGQYESQMDGQENQKGGILSHQ